ncbi:MAG: rRNA maturation RNase YbeY [Oscillospiraceae bacterium]|nr:rRNA maturation RNase YbeY [Oscillospiraceae bacterium]
MAKLKLNLTYEKPSLLNVPVTRNIKRCVEAALDAEGVTALCEINILITDDIGIHGINKAARNIDRPTDVLSFPMFTFEPGVLPEDWSEFKDPGTNAVPLGDMVISLERARAQAKEFGHSVKREVGYLTIHSMLHLLGYDHLDEGPMKKQMRAREEAIAATIEGMSRD